MQEWTQRLVEWVGGEIVSTDLEEHTILRVLGLSSSDLFAPSPRLAVCQLTWSRSEEARENDFEDPEAYETCHDELCVVPDSKLHHKKHLFCEKCNIVLDFGTGSLARACVVKRRKQTMQFDAERIQSAVGAQSKKTCVDVDFLGASCPKHTDHRNGQ